MKLILEYRKPNSRWLSFGPELKVTTHSEVEMNIFGYIEDREKQTWVSTPYTLNVRPCTKTVSQATLGNLYDFQTVGFNNEVPISKSSLKVEPQNVALLYPHEYEDCLKDAKNILEYEAILAAAKHIAICGYDVRLFVFRN